MIDLVYYQLKHKLNMVKASLKAIDDKLDFSWHEEPIKAIDVARLATLSSALLLEVATTANNNVNVDLCAKMSLQESTKTEDLEECQS